jgi:CHAT domain-containing protein
MLRRQTISYSPSATVLEVVERTWAPADCDLEFVGFGDPAFADEEDAAQEPRAAARAFRLAGKPIARLPASGEEVEAIAAEFGDAAEHHLRKDATEHRARTRAPLARFVHFATHSLLDDQRPLNSGLVLAPPSEAEMRDDGGLDDMLQAFEMFSLRLSAEVVVCSACQTGLGTMRAGEGMVGMSRALFFAGARNLVVSLWPVQDEPTSELMQELYRHLRNGSPTAEALQAARETTRCNNPDPRHWAGFIAIGPS